MHACWWCDALLRREDRVMTEIGQKAPRVRDPKYLAWLRLQPCCLCGNDRSEACHIRSGSIAYGKRETGMSEKPDDKWAVPMDRSCHGKQHAMNELEFWRSYGIDPFGLASRYYARAAFSGHSSPIARKPGRPRKQAPAQKRKIQSRGFR